MSLNDKDKVILGSSAEATVDVGVANSGAIAGAIISVGATGALTQADTIAMSVGGLSLAWALSKAALGSTLKLRQQRALEWVEMVRDNPELFTQELMETEEFQDGFVVALEEYLKIRTILKRAMARKVFEGFATTQDKQSFSLESYFDVLRTISPEAIEMLKTIDNKFRLSKTAEARKEINLIDVEKSGYTEEQLIQFTESRYPLSMFFEKWLDENVGDRTEIWLPSKPDPNHPTTTGSSQAWTPNVNRQLHYELIDELGNLNILRISISVVNAENMNRPISRKSWELSKFGEEFIKFLET